MCIVYFQIWISIWICLYLHGWRVPIFYLKGDFRFSANSVCLCICILICICISFRFIFDYNHKCGWRVPYFAWKETSASLLIPFAIKMFLCHPQYHQHDLGFTMIIIVTITSQVSYFWIKSHIRYIQRPLHPSNSVVALWWWSWSWS